tara:strand:+ start:17 stop:433 length:417 start_codon:yes stop_codon:yes gene_type:complete
MRFENDNDLKREVKAIALFCKTFLAKWTKLGDNDIDFKVTKGDKVCYVEVKGRNRNLADAYPLPIAARKVVKLCDKKLPAIVIWDCLDGLIYANIYDITSKGKVGGRKPREGSYNDVEYMLYFNKQENLFTIKKDLVS